MTPASTTATDVGSGPLASAFATTGTEVGLDECSLLPASEIETATGYEVVRSGADPSGLSDCVWTLSGDGGSLGLSVELDSPRAQKDHEFDCTVGFGLTPLDGVGDSACGDPIAGGTYLLYALRGDDRVWLTIQANYLIDGSAWVTLARAAVAKLP